MLARFRGRRRASVVLAAGAPVAAVGAAAPPAQAAHIDKVERSVVRRINGVRHQHGLRGLRISGRMSTGAARHSAAMARRGVMAHGSWYGRVSRYAGTRTIGEVVAYVRTRSSRQARWVVRGWLNSPPHRAVILSGRFRRAGIGRRWTRPGGVTFFTLDTAK